jgi:hypothetical protein
MFDKAMTKSIGAYLQPGEELLSATIIQGKGLGKVALAGGAFGAMAAASRRDRKAREAEANGEAPEIKLSSKMGIAITTQRLLVFRAGGSMTLSAKELLTAIPIGDVENIEVGKGVVTKPITVTVRGEAFHVEAPRAANTDKLLTAFAQATAGRSATAA